MKATIRFPSAFPLARAVDSGWHHLSRGEFPQERLLLRYLQVPVQVFPRLKLVLYPRLRSRHQHLVHRPLLLEPSSFANSNPLFD